MSIHDSLKKQLDETKAHIESIGALIKVQHGPAAHALFSIVLNSTCYTTLVAGLLADYLPKSKFDLFMALMEAQTLEAVSKVIEAGGISKEVQGIIMSEIDRVEMARTELESSMLLAVKNIENRSRPDQP